MSNGREQNWIWNRLDELEDEYFAYLDVLPAMFDGAGLGFEAEQVFRINWVVWGVKKSPPVAET